MKKLKLDWWITPWYSRRRRRQSFYVAVWCVFRVVQLLRPSINDLFSCILYISVTEKKKSLQFVALCMDIIMHSHRPNFLRKCHYNVRKAQENLYLFHNYMEKQKYMFVFSCGIKSIFATLTVLWQGCREYSQ